MFAEHVKVYNYGRYITSHHVEKNCCVHRIMQTAVTESGKFYFGGTYQFVGHNYLLYEDIYKHLSWWNRPKESKKINLSEDKQW